MRQLQRNTRGRMNFHFVMVEREERQEVVVELSGGPVLQQDQYLAQWR